MLAYPISLKGQRVATAGLREGVVSAIANWIFVRSDVTEDPDRDWSASFSLAGLDDVTSEQLKWFRHDVQIGDEISIQLIETNQIDEPTERAHGKDNSSNSSADDAELSRLTNMLRDIDAQLPPDSPLREGLRKSGSALHLLFMRGLRPELDGFCETFG